MRHVNADKKLADWAAQARERELEKVAAKHARDQERAALQEAEQQVQGMQSAATLQYYQLDFHVHWVCIDLNKEEWVHVLCVLLSPCGGYCPA